MHFADWLHGFVHDWRFDDNSGALEMFLVSDKQIQKKSEAGRDVESIFTFRARQ